MNKLKKIIEEYPEWQDLSIYIERIETHIDIDFSLSIENAKALLESVGKEICNKKGIELDNNISINSVLKKSFSSIGYTNTNLVNKISSALATIAQQVGELRNNIGLTAHGKPLEEIKQRNSNIDILTREFLIDTVEMICTFIIRAYENKKEVKIVTEPLCDLIYSNEDEFNEFWDNQFGEFSMGDYSYTASEILFNVDNDAYLMEYKSFKETIEE